MDKGKTYVKNNPVLINASSILYEGRGKTLDKLFDLVYPVGSVYISTSATSPQTLFGGSWTKIEGRFLWATGSAPMTTGGSRTTDSTILTIDQIPNHRHTSNAGVVWDDTNGLGNTWWIGVNGVKAGAMKANSDVDGLAAPWMGHGDYATSYTGGSQGHTHTYMPPYFEVYMWYRTA